MKNIHILPTPNPSRLVKQKYDEIDRLCLADIATKRAEYKRFNLYITSDEIVTEYSKGLYFMDVYTGKKHIFSPILINKETIALGKFHTYMNNGNMCKKIIMTTDPILILNGVQAIDDDFLEWFVKNPSCEEVELSVFQIQTSDTTTCVDYKIIIPKEEIKQETLTGDITIFKSVFKKEHIYNTSIMDFLQFCKKGKEVGIYYKSTLKDVLTLYTKTFNDESNE